VPSRPASSPAPPVRLAPTVVAVGASAGGLDAFSQILENLASSPQVAFVFVQHLSPQHESALASLLSAKTRLPVLQATDGIAIEPNHVYVIPPNMHMEVVGGHLNLLPRPHDRSQFTPVDFFFESVARWAQERAIGVILSGTASDGAIGIREIKAAGGITIAQTPDSARYDGMPRSAIATGMIDLVLSPKEIADHISHIRQHPYLVRKDDGEPGEDGVPTEEQFRELFSILRRTSGIDFKQYKTPTVKRRLLRRMALHRLSDVEGYLRYIRANPPEATALCQDLLIHVTRFFRDPDSFKALEAQAFPEIAADRREDAIRIWVPGCATGEEAYSVAIGLLEMLGDRVSERKVQIFATDVSDGAIEHARSGTYAPSIAADVSPERLKRFFTKSDGGYRVSKILRDMCVFARHDLARDPPFSRLDLVVCRNVLIYLDATLQRRLISVFHYALRPRGFLMLGSAETTGSQSWFTVVDKKWRLYRKAPVDTIAFGLPTEVPQQPKVLPALQAVVRPEGRPVQEEANRVILDKYGPPGVVVDANLEIVHFRGHTGPFLEAASGEPSLNVLKMARGGLLHPLRSALALARRRRRTVRKEGVLVQRNSDWRAINIDVLPLITARGEYFLILFESPPQAPGGKGRKAAPVRERDSATDGRVADLRRELAASREYLQSIIQELEAANEELQSANEEILSSNEELQSTNEELDTAKEELQSTNEELNTVNEELHSRNDELARANSDLVNLLGSVDLPLVIVGDDMAIRRFTPTAERLFNLIPGDVGRPIGQINPNIVFDDLKGLIQKTIDDISSQERDVQDRDGHWYSLRIRPYRSIDNRIDGAVIAAIDIDATNRYQRLLERSRESIMKVVESVAKPLFVLDPHLRVRITNKSFQQAFDVRPPPTEGMSLGELGRSWDNAELRATIDAAASNEGDHQMSFDHVFPRVGLRRISASAKGFELEDSRQWILVSVDVSDAHERA
jgi:two-component system CheB/CheR fusion protein